MTQERCGVCQWWHRYKIEPDKCGLCTLWLEDRFEWEVCSSFLQENTDD